MTGPSIRPDSITSGYWSFPNGPDGEPVFRQPYDDPMTPFFDEFWEAVMGRHSDSNRDGVADFAQSQTAKDEAQSAVFHDATEVDWVSDDDLERMQRERKLVIHPREDT